MDMIQLDDQTAGTSLRLVPSADGRVALTVMRGPGPEHTGVILRREWFRPLASWLAGEAGPGIVGHDEYGMPYGRWLVVAGDETAVVYGTHTWAQLRCSEPFGPALVTVGPRGLARGLTVLLTFGGRTDVAAWLRRADAESWAKSAV